MKGIVLVMSLNIQLSVTLLLPAADRVAFVTLKAVSNKKSLCVFRSLISVMFQCTMNLTLKFTAVSWKCLSFGNAQLLKNSNCSQHFCTEQLYIAN